MYRRLACLSALLIGAYCLLMIVLGGYAAERVTLVPASVLLAGGLDESWP